MVLTEAGAEAVTIESLAAGGAGVTHLADGMIAFVPRTAPGDRVRLAHVRRHRRYAIARAGDVIEAGPSRVPPPCAHFTADRCGGCQWQHIAAAGQAAAKRRIVGDALRRIGGLDLPEPALVASPRVLGYRATVTLTVRWSGGGEPVVGFHDEAEPDRVFPLEHCAIARDELNALWRALKPAASHLPRGDDVRLKMRVEPGGALHVLVSGGDRAWTGGEALESAAREAGMAVTVWWQPEGGAVRRMAGPDAYAAAVAFGQVNPDVAGMLWADVVGCAVRREPCAGDAGGSHAPRTTPHAPSRILDLYAGAGETALPLAERGHEVVLVEMDERSVRRAESRAAASGLSLRCIAGLVEDHLAGLLPADVVIVNPPRTGLSESVTAQLAADPAHGARRTAHRLIYVSCDPATLARDLKRMTVRSEDVQIVRSYDMFPQTSHVETLVVVERA